VQDEIAGAVANALRKTLLGNETVSKAPTTNFEAYNAYLLGLSYYHIGSQESWQQAIEQFQLALEKDPNMALAWAGLSRATSLQTGSGSDFTEGYTRARLAANKAIELDPDLADAHSALAEIQMSSDWDWDGAQASLDRAYSLRPGDPEILLEMANLKWIRGDVRGAEEDIEQAMRQDPLNNLVNRRYVGTLARKGRLDEALAKGKFLANAMPETGGVHYGVSNVQMRLGNFEEALVWAKKETFGHLRLMNEAIIYHELGDHETAQQKLQEIIDTWGDDASAQVSEVYAAWGNVDETFAALERGFLVRDPGIVYIQSDDQMLELLKDDPRYDAFLRKLNLL
jgi:adenylate cyclase